MRGGTHTEKLVIYLFSNHCTRECKRGMRERARACRAPKECLPPRLCSSCKMTSRQEPQWPVWLAMRARKSARAHTHTYTPHTRRARGRTLASELTTCGCIMQGENGTACPAGFSSKDGTDGRYYTPVAPVACGADGNYDTGSRECEECAPGSYTNASGATFCAECGANTFSDAGSTACLACPSYSNSPVASASCTCNAGFESLAGGNCTACPAGKYDTGSRECEECAPGTYTNASGATACEGSPCAPGTYGLSNATSAASAVCVGCDSGKFALTGSPACTNCPVGKYANASAASACADCPAGSSSQIGSTDVNNCTCDAGYSGTRGGICTLCAAGKFNARQVPPCSADVCSDKYGATFVATGCCNANPVSQWWQGRSEDTVLEDMLAYCSKVKAGNADAGQIAFCGCGVGVLPTVCERQSAFVQPAVAPTTASVCSDKTAVQCPAGSVPYLSLAEGCTADAISGTCLQNGAWRLLFRQTYPFTFDTSQDWAEAKELNADDDSQPNFSILGRLEEFRLNDGSFVMRYNHSESGSLSNVWKQTSNPANATGPGVTGYEAIDEALEFGPGKGSPGDGLRWLGLESQGSNCFLRGHRDNGDQWWYAIATARFFQNGIPAEHPTKAKQVELWVWDAGCQPGYSGNYPSCAACVEGKFKNWTGSAECQECSKGKYSSTQAAVFCSDMTVSECMQNQSFAVKTRVCLEGYYSRDMGPQLQKSKNPLFQAQAWNVGCFHGSGSSSATECKSKCEQTDGCCNYYGTLMPPLLSAKCQSNSCSGGGCCAASENICKSACEMYFQPLPTFQESLTGAIADDGFCANNASSTQASTTSPSPSTPPPTLDPTSCPRHSTAAPGTSSCVCNSGNQCTHVWLVCTICQHRCSLLSRTLLSLKIPRLSGFTGRSCLIRIRQPVGEEFARQFLLKITLFVNASDPKESEKLLGLQLCEFFSCLPSETFNLSAFRHARRSGEVWIPSNASVSTQFVVDAECTFVTDWDNFNVNMLETLHDLNDFLGEFVSSSNLPKFYVNRKQIWGSIHYPITFLPAYPVMLKTAPFCCSSNF